MLEIELKRIFLNLNNVLISERINYRTFFTSGDVLNQLSRFHHWGDPVLLFNKDVGSVITVLEMADIFFPNFQQSSNPVFFFFWGGGGGILQTPHCR